MTNESPALAAASLARLTARFERGQAVSEGGGLGLSIVEAIARGARARLELRSPARGRADGFEAVFNLPAPA